MPSFYLPIRTPDDKPFIPRTISILWLSKYGSQTLLGQNILYNVPFGNLLQSLSESTRNSRLPRTHMLKIGFVKTIYAISRSDYQFHYRSNTGTTAVQRVKHLGVKDGSGLELMHQTGE